MLHFRPLAFYVIIGPGVLGIRSSVNVIVTDIFVDLSFHLPLSSLYTILGPFISLNTGATECFQGLLWKPMSLSVLLIQWPRVSLSPNLFIVNA